MKIFFSLILVPVIFLWSCHPGKKIQNAISKRDTVTAVHDSTAIYHNDSIAFIRENYHRITGQHIDYTTFSAKIDVDYFEDNGKRRGVTAHVRMYKDSLLWISITGPLGIEGMRAYITQDSVKVLDKLNKKIILRSVTYLQDVTELPVDLSLVQDLLVGNPVFLDSNIVSYSTNPGTISLLSIGENFKNLFTIDADSKRTISSKLDDKDPLKNRTCHLAYSNYEPNGSIQFPTYRDINVAEKKKLEILLDFKQFAFNETLSFPFNIPKNYKED